MIALSLYHILCLLGQANIQREEVIQKYKKEAEIHGSKMRLLLTISLFVHALNLELT